MLKVAAVGFCLLCAILGSVYVFRSVQRERAQAAAAGSVTSPGMPGVWESGNGLPAGTVVSVTVADPINSDHDPSGKEYEASVDTIDGQTAAPGSQATVILLNNNSGWITRLSGLTLAGRKLQAFSGAGAVVGTEQSKGGPSDGSVWQVGLANGPPPVADPPLVLPSAAHLRFVLLASPAPAKVAATGPRGPVAGLRTEPDAGAGQEKIAYFCRAVDTSDSTLPIAYYVADVFKTSDAPALVEKSWHEYLMANYPYRFVNNPHATSECKPLPDDADDANAGLKLEGQLKSDGGQVVQTRWHYTLGPPPSPSAAVGNSVR